MNLPLIDYCFALQQQKLYNRYVNGLDSNGFRNRLELNCNSQTNFNAGDLQMRRKAEVLQYNNQAAITTHTKKEKYSRLLKNIRSVSSRVCQSTTKTICNPSSASDVPGPIMQLCYNPSIPFVDINNTNSNKRLTSTPLDSLSRYYHVTTFPDVFFVMTPPNKNAIPNKIADITILNFPTRLASFQIKVPISFFMNGNVGQNPTNFDFMISGIQISIYINDRLLYDVSDNINVKIDVSNIPQQNMFTISRFIGTTTFTTPPLETSKQTTFSVIISNVKISPIKGDVLINNFSIVSNISGEVDNYYNNVIPTGITITPALPNFVPFSVNAILP